MINKTAQRKKAFNQFRFTGLFQKRIQVKRQKGNEFEDYQTVSWLYLAKKLIKPMERSLFNAQEISADLKIHTRYFSNLSNGDRILFLNDSQKSSKLEDIVRVSSYGDPDGRKEYLDIIGAYGAYAGPAPIQPKDKNRIVIKSFFETTELANMFVSDNWNEKKPTKFYGLNSLHIDFFILGRNDNVFLCKNTGQNPAFPCIFTVNEFSEVIAKDVEDVNTEIPFAKVSTQNGLNFWAKSDYLIPAGTQKMLFFEVKE